MHVHVDGASTGAAAVVPQAGEQHAAGVHPVRRRDEVGEQVELEAGQLELATLDDGAALVGVDRYVERACEVVARRARVRHQRERRPCLLAAAGRQPGGLPGPEATDHVGRPAYADLLQRGRGQARGVALGAQHQHVQVVGRDRQPRVAGRVEPPLQHVALDEQRARDVALLGALGRRPDVDEHGAALPGLHGAQRVEPQQPGPGHGEQVDDRLRGRGAHQSVPECSSETTWGRPSSSRT